MKKVALVAVVLSLAFVAVAMVSGCSTTKTSADAMHAGDVSCVCDNKPISKDIYSDWNGRRVYFCSPDCKQKFDNDPNKEKFSRRIDEQARQFREKASY